MKHRVMQNKPTPSSEPVQNAPCMGVFYSTPSYIHLSFSSFFLLFKAAGFLFPLDKMGNKMIFLFSP